MSEETLSNINLDDYVPPQAFAPNAEINVKCIDAEFKDGVSQKNGKEWEGLSLVLVPVDNEADYPEITNPSTIYHMIFLPTNGSTPIEINRARGNLKRVYDAIGEYPAGGKPQIEDFKEKTFRIAVKKGNRADGTESNDVKKFVASL